VKTILWTTATVLAIVLMSMGMNMHLMRTALELSGQLELVQQAVLAERWADAEFNFQQATEKWEQTRSVWAVVIRHQEIDELEVAFARISQFLSTREQGETLAELEVAKVLLEHVPAKERLLLQNIM
jgi:hypothetical protein